MIENSIFIVSGYGRTNPIERLDFEEDRLIKQQAGLGNLGPKPESGPDIV